MENFHSTKNLIIERYESSGTRMIVNNVENCTSKNGRFSTQVFKDISHNDGDVYRKFFELLDSDAIKSAQGAILRCDKKKGYWFDETKAFPKGVAIDSSHKASPNFVYFNFRTARYTDGSKHLKYVYYPIGFTWNDASPIHEEYQKARFIRDNLNALVTKDNMKVVEYLTDQFEKVPNTYLTFGEKFPRDITVTSVNSKTERARTVIKTSTGEDKIFTLDISKYPKFLHKSLYAFYIAKTLESSHIIAEGSVISFNKDSKKIDVTIVKEPVISESKTETAKTESTVQPKTIADPISKEAQDLIGKRVYASNRFNMGDDKVVGILRMINPTANVPFVVGSANYLFIMEAPEPSVECYKFDDPELRAKLFGKIFTDDAHSFEEMVYSFSQKDGRWTINGKYTAYKFMNECRWIDGSKCGTVEEV